MREIDQGKYQYFNGSLFEEYQMHTFPFLMMTRCPQSILNLREAPSGRFGKYITVCFFPGGANLLSVHCVISIVFMPNLEL